MIFYSFIIVTLHTWNIWQEGHSKRMLETCENSPKIISTCMNEHLYELWATNLKIWVSWRQKYAFITKLYFWFAFVTIGVSKSFFKLCMRLLLLFATQVVQRKHLTKCVSFSHQLYTTYLLVWRNYISLQYNNFEVFEC